jgi:NagD protein
MNGDTMETDIRGAVESGMLGYLVLSGSTQLEHVGDYVYQPSRILDTVGDLTAEVLGIADPKEPQAPGQLNPSPHSGRLGTRHQTDILAFHTPRPRPAMTK